MADQRLEIKIGVYEDDVLIVRGGGFSFDSAEEDLGKLERFYQKHLKEEVKEKIAKEKEDKE